MAAVGAAGRVPVSFELFPPRSDAAAIALGRTIDRLAEAEPAFISVTFGAGGSLRDRSLTVLRYILEHTDAPALAHLTCVGSDHAAASDLVRAFLDAGVTRFLALRGDPPADGSSPAAGLASSAELVQLIRRVDAERRAFEPRDLPGGGASAEPRRARRPHVAVAAFPSGHPRERTPWQDIDALLAKQAAGADSAITQILFDADDYAQYAARAAAAGVTIPILPGIMPVRSADQLRRMAALSDQAPPPRLLAALDDAATDDAAAAVGLEHAERVARGVLAAGAPGLHLYTFNRHEAILPLLGRLDLLPA